MKKEKKMKGQRVKKGFQSKTSVGGKKEIATRVC